MSESLQRHPSNHSLELVFVIVNFNKAYSLKKCINHALEQRTSHSYRVVVVDNASSDSSREVILSYGKRILPYFLSSNTGGAGGFDYGIKQAAKLDPEFICLLDNDAYIPSHLIDSAIKYLDAQPGVGALGAKIVMAADNSRVQEYGGEWNKWTMRLKPLGYSKASSSFKDVCEVDYAPACCLIVRTKAVQEAGSMDPALFFLGDDIEFCHRLRQAGYAIHSNRDIAVQHDFWGDKGWIPGRLYYVIRNRFILFLDRMNKNPIRRFTSSFIFTSIVWTFGSAFLMAGRRDVFQTVIKAGSDYLRNLSGGAKTLKTNSFQSARLGPTKRLLLFGFNNGETIEQLPIEVFESISKVIIALPAHFDAKKQEIREALYHRSIRDIQFLGSRGAPLISMVRKIRFLFFPRNTLLINGKQASLFSLFAKRTFYFEAHTFYECSEDSKLDKGIGILCIIGLPLVAILFSTAGTLKSYLFPNQYEDDSR